MPIANCIVKNNISIESLHSIEETLSTELNIPSTDITINVIRSELQLGKTFACMIYLYLPSLWSKEDVRRIEMSFFTTIGKGLNLSKNELFLITSIVESGNIVSEGQVEEW